MIWVMTQAPIIQFTLAGSTEYQPKPLLVEVVAVTELDVEVVAERVEEVDDVAV